MHQATSLSTLFLMAGVLASAQIVPNRYIVELDGDPAATFAAKQGHKAQARDAVFQSRAAQIRTQHAAARQALQQSGAQVLNETSTVLNAMMVSIPDANVSQLSSIPGVVKIYPVRLYHPVLDHALPLHHVPDAWNQIGGSANAGLGVKIGIIDTGIDSSHPAFQDPSLPMPDGFPLVNQSSDKAYTNNKIIVARSYTDGSSAPNGRDEVGHGTGVAMTAAGMAVTGVYATISGVAPKAYLGSYKVFPSTTGGAPDDLIIKGIEDAVNDGMNVLNLSLGSGAAGRPADDPLVAAVEGAVAAGDIVTIAAGNIGPDPNTIASPGTAPDAISVGAMSNDRLFSGSFSSGSGDPVIAIPGSGPNSSTPVTAPLQDVAQFDSSGLACSSLPAGSLSGSIALILRGTCTFEQKINNAAQAGAIAALVYATAASPDPINMAVGAATLPASMVSNQTGVSLKQQIASDGVTGTISFALGPIGQDPNVVSSFSSRGPSADTSIKPDLLAAGDPIYTAQPLKNDGSTDDGFVAESGTSFSSPMVAGAAALLVGARPGLTASQYRSLLINSASFFGNQALVQNTGGGFLNVNSALQATVAASPASLGFGYGSGTVSQNASLTLTNLGSASDTFTLTVVSQTGGTTPSLSSNTVQLDPGRARIVTVQFAGSGLSSGAYQGYIQVQGTQGEPVANIPYWYAVPSGVPAQITVLDSPTTATANSSQSVLFRVTDSSGIPVSQPAKVSFVAGSGTVVRTASYDSQVPGAYQIQLRMGPKTSLYTVQIQVGSLTQTVNIPGN